MPKRVDKNHGQCRDAAREIPGVWVADTHELGKGFPDLVLGSRYGATIIGNVPLEEIQRRLADLPVMVHKGYSVPVEVKTETGKLTRDEQRWFRRWPALVVIVRNEDEMLNWTGIIE